MNSGDSQRARKISIDVRKAGPVINKNIYGQFAEHLGRLFYDGMWVGPDSDIPNTRGWRNDVLEALRDLVGRMSGSQGYSRENGRVAPG